MRTVGKKNGKRKGEKRETKREKRKTKNKKKEKSGNGTKSDGLIQSKLPQFWLFRSDPELSILLSLEVGKNHILELFPQLQQYFRECTECNA